MKKIHAFIFLFTLSILPIQNTFGQDEERKFTIQTTPYLYALDLAILGVSDESFFIIDLEGQYKINNILNISFTVSLLVNVVESYDLYDVWSGDVFQMGFKPMLVFRPLKTGLKGFYIGVYPNIGFEFIKTENEDLKFTEIGLGIDIGYKWVLGSGFTVQIGGGIGKKWSVPEKSKDIVDSFINSDGSFALKNYDTRFDFKLGYSF
jgi:hypothetical protein